MIVLIQYSDTATSFTIGVSLPTRLSENFCFCPSLHSSKVWPQAQIHISIPVHNGQESYSFRLKKVVLVDISKKHTKTIFLGQREYQPSPKSWICLNFYSQQTNATQEKIKATIVAWTLANISMSTFKIVEKRLTWAGEVCWGYKYSHTLWLRWKFKRETRTREKWETKERDLAQRVTSTAVSAIYINDYGIQNYKKYTL